jgi:glucoamylase
MWTHKIHCKERSTAPHIWNRDLGVKLYHARRRRNPPNPGRHSDGSARKVSQTDAKPMTDTTMPARHEAEQAHQPALPSRIEDYAMIGDRVTAALVDRRGSIDWLCLPRFDGGACFAALLGTSDNGRWLIAPKAEARVSRSYMGDSMVLETIFETDTGSVALIDFLVPEADHVTLVRLVQGRHGRVAMHMDLALRFDYGTSIPWVTRLADHSGICAIVGPDMVVLRTPANLRGQDMHTIAEFSVAAGHTVPFVLSHGPSHRPPPGPVDGESALRTTQAFWAEFIGRCSYEGRYKAAVHRSLLTLKALTYAPTGGIVAAATTSLPEEIGGTRNWDYRYCWLRDATLSLFALMHAGYTQEAAEWRDWLQRSIAGDPGQIQIMYGLKGERRLDEWEVPWLAGYEASKPVRIGNAASAQVQLDVYGEVLNCLHMARRRGLQPAPHGWALQRGILRHLCDIWKDPDEGMWETRGGPQHFTLSKIMAWVAVDRMIRDATHYHLSGPVDEWRAIRKEIYDRVMREGFDAQRNCFTQSFGSKALDASLLLIARTGFIDPRDPRMLGTVAAIEQDLMQDGFLLRYRTGDDSDGLPAGEGAFLACTFWLADAYLLQGRTQEAEALFERLLALRNDVGLLSEEYDPKRRRQVGNFPQAFSHVALVTSAFELSGVGGAGSVSGADQQGSLQAEARES